MTKSTVINLNKESADKLLQAAFGGIAETYGYSFKVATENTVMTEEEAKFVDVACHIFNVKKEH